MADLFPDKKLYIHVFTDDQNPKRICEQYQTAINNPNIIFGTRDSDNSHATHVIEDLFAMTHFDCMIRADSNFAIVASKLGNFMVIISPDVQEVNIKDRTAPKKAKISLYTRYYAEYDQKTKNAELIATKKETVTNRIESDGFGSQFQGIIASVIYAELNNANYVYTPFQKMEHNYDNDPCFIAQKESLINFIDNFALNKNNVVSKINYKTFFDTHVDSCASSSTLQKIKKIFRQNKNCDQYFKNENFNIVIHMRRPNPHDSRIDGTNTPNAFFLEIINKLRILYAVKNPLFHIQSQGPRQLFEQFKANDIVLHLDEPIEDSFLSMVLADVLVTGRSSFSYTAGLLSEGIVYYIPFWHKPLPNWISVHTL